MSYKLFDDVDMTGIMTVNDLKEACDWLVKTCGDYHIMFGDGYFPKKDAIAYYPADRIMAIRPTAYDKLEIKNMLDVISSLESQLDQMKATINHLHLYPDEPKEGVDINDDTDGICVK